MPGPHASWAGVYEQACLSTFGRDYRRMTEKSMQTIAEWLQPPARIVDFGAGAGRMALPLAQCGYSVTAVDSCQEMLDALKQQRRGANPRCVVSTIRDFTTSRPFDMALCLFTVLVYILEDEDLDASMQAMARALAPGGFLFIDVPGEQLFQSFIHEDATLRREVSVADIGDGRFNYSECITVAGDGDTVTYTDEFPIRHWPLTHVLQLLRHHGFEEAADVSRRFSRTGSMYLLLRKTGTRSGRAR
ncbi:MAG: class I SAM-dependent methyltransferase [Ignavibacteriae bacterium]|nr:class I SAM-dependent methyltransferase [Ignavibacteriota bacterium]